MLYLCAGATRSFWCSYHVLFHLFRNGKSEIPTWEGGQYLHKEEKEEQKQEVQCTGLPEELLCVVSQVIFKKSKWLTFTYFKVTYEYWLILYLSTCICCMWSIILTIGLLTAGHTSAHARYAASQRAADRAGQVSEICHNTTLYLCACQERCQNTQVSLIK